MKFSGYQDCICLRKKFIFDAPPTLFQLLIQFLNASFVQWQLILGQPEARRDMKLPSPAWATNKSIFDGKSHAIHHFYELFKLISAM